MRMHTGKVSQGPWLSRGQVIICGAARLCCLWAKASSPLGVWK